MRDKKSLGVSILGLAGLSGILALAVVMNSNAPIKTDDLRSYSDISSLDIDNGDLKIDWSNYPKYDLELAKTSTIAKGGIYHVTGELIDSPLIINAGNDKVRLILDEVTIENSTGPAIICYAADDLVIELKGESALSDGNKYDSSLDADINGVIYSKADLTFEGSGSLILNAKYQDGIVTKDDLKFNSGNYTITAADDAIRGKDSVYIVNGEFNITSRSDGIKATNDTTAGKGFVLIENGHIIISAGDDAVHAETALMVQGGNINVAKSYEGLEAHVVTINGGDIKIVSSDDGINAAGNSTTATESTNGISRPRDPMGEADESSIIAINGGNVYVNASGDGIDSNGYVYINGGTVIVDGPTNNGNGALDVGIGVIANGGTLLAIGASGMSVAPNETSKIASANIFLDTFYPAETKIKIKDEAGETIFRYTSAKKIDNIVIALPEFKIGETYRLYLNEKEIEKIALSSITTVVGNSNKAFNSNIFPGNRDGNIPEMPDGEMPEGETPDDALNGEIPHEAPNGKMPNEIPNREAPNEEKSELTRPPVMPVDKNSEMPPMDDSPFHSSEK